MDTTVQQRISQEVADNPVVLYMKGTPVFPQCGFSAAVVQMLSHLGVKFKGIDVLADPGTVIEAARAAGVSAYAIGSVGGVALTLPGAGAISVDTFRAANEAWLPDYMAQV